MGTTLAPAHEPAKEREHRPSAQADTAAFEPTFGMDPVLRLQRQAGNQAVQRLLRSRGIQAKLAVSNSGDPDEREAEQVADHVMRMHTGCPATGVVTHSAGPKLSRKCACGGAGKEKCAECKGKNNSGQQELPTSNAVSTTPYTPTGGTAAYSLHRPVSERKKCGDDRYGCADCDDYHGTMKIAVDHEHCAGNCVVQHEQTHADDQAVCCKRYSLCLTKAPPGQNHCRDAWDEWVNSVSDWTECNAFRIEDSCLNTIISKQCTGGSGSRDEKCCADLNTELHFVAERIAEHCPKSVQMPCPFKEDGSVTRLNSMPNQPEPQQSNPQDPGGGTLSQPQEHMSPATGTGIPARAAATASSSNRNSISSPVGVDFSTPMQPGPGDQHRRSIQAKLAVSQPGDPDEREADQVADRIMRSPGGAPISSPEGEEMCAECQQKQGAAVARKAESSGHIDSDPSIVHEVLRSPGQPLDSATRAFFEPRFGHDFSNVRVHTDAEAAGSAHAVNALAYTAGPRIVFGTGEYRPSEPGGRRLLAHELTHVVQQRGEAGQALGLVQRQAGGTNPTPTDPGPGGPTAAGTGRTGGIPKPETCPAPPDLGCSATKASVAGVTKTIQFVVDKSGLDKHAMDEIHDAAKSWHAAGGTGTVRIDGYASADYECVYNWRLSCRRAEAVASELEHPTDGSKGVPSANVSTFAHGESDEAGPSLAPNRRVTISVLAAPTKPVVPVPPTKPVIPVPPSKPVAPVPPPSAACKLPASLGVGRTGCGTGTDFTHFDFPSISLKSELKLAAWAAAHGATTTPLVPVLGLPFRSKVSNLECELEMAGVLTGFARSAGLNAFLRFKAGTGGTETHGAGSTLGTDALASGSFARTLAAVKLMIESQLAAQAASGKLDACALSVTPPPTHFSVSDGMTLKAVIGGTHGESLNVTAFTGDIPTRTYSINLEFLICDNFGVDEADLYAPGLFGFWVLQHERSATLFAPFINLLDLPVTVSGTF